jgi:histidinol-phosphate aminotransferase
MESSAYTATKAEVAVAVGVGAHDAKASVGGAVPLARYTMGDAPKAGARRLHLNEFRFDHHPAVSNKALEVAASQRTLIEYSAGPPKSLVKAIGGYVNVPPEHVFVAAGSDEILRAIIGMCARRGITDAIGGVPTYTHFIHFVEQGGLRWHPVMMGLRSTSADRVALVELRKPLLERGALVYLVSPNNPTGDTWSREVVSGWALAYPKSVFVVDEAYTEFEGVQRLPSEGVGRGGPSSDLNAASLALLTLTRQNVVAARTFSKAFGLAGLRIGYGVACPSLADEVSAFVNPKAVTTLASACAESCLATDSLLHYQQCAITAVEQRSRLHTELKSAGWYVEPGGGNFMLLFVGDGPAISKHLAEAGVHVRDRSGLPELHGFVRITAGSREDTDATIAALKKLEGIRSSNPIQKFYTAKSVVVRLRQHLALVAPILTARGISWWACDGTLLGWGRCRGIIPHDDDIDLGYVFLDGQDPIGGLVDEFARVGLTLQRNRTNAYWQVGVDLPKNPTSPVHECIDLFPFHVDRTGFYINADPRFQQETTTGPECNTRYAPDDLFPLRTGEFYDGTIPIPAKAEVVLARAVGPNWETHAIVRSAIEKGGPPRFRVVDRSPA